MKKLLRLVVVLALVSVGGSVWLFQSVHYVLFELKDAVDKQDLARVEQHCDLDRVAASILDFGQATVEANAEATAGAAGASVMKNLGGLFRAVTDGQTKKALKDDIRAAVAEGRAKELLGPFDLQQGFTALEGIDTPADGVRRVRFAGKCEGGPATIEVDFIRKDGGKFGLPTWQCVGMDKEAAARLARTCVANARAKG